MGSTRPIAVGIRLLSRDGNGLATVRVAIGFNWATLSCRLSPARSGSAVEARTFVPASRSRIGFSLSRPITMASRSWPNIQLRIVVELVLALASLTAEKSTSIRI